LDHFLLPIPFVGLNSKQDRKRVASQRSEREVLNSPLSASQIVRRLDPVVAAPWTEKPLDCITNRGSAEFGDCAFPIQSAVRREKEPAEPRPRHPFDGDRSRRTASTRNPCVLHFSLGSNRGHSSGLVERGITRSCVSRRGTYRNRALHNRGRASCGDLLPLPHSRTIRPSSGPIALLHKIFK